MTIDNKKGLINCIYAGGTQFSAQIEAILKAAKKDTHGIDITKTMPSDTLWHDMAKRLNTSLRTFINIPKIEGYNADANYSEESLVKILAKHPKAMIGTIVMEGETIMHITRYTELLNFFNVDSAGLEKTMHTQSPTTKRQTENESFV
ncbi:hypothetical protein BWZ20_01705 [Winogradskyella sp. J14-2]|uniref:arsenate reductase family protein n=1 Tax=Winogradskyella sp. J14-2 TaxID=1936080 RepID=UPI000972A19E|nr:hypothetical protein [Winogradskyella sp. J14-2]APY07094.1 hypothetical protein BWZ20_01705 [Winogradskyella sp. J14-2]